MEDFEDVLKYLRKDFYDLQKRIVELRELIIRHGGGDPGAPQDLLLGVTYPFSKGYKEKINYILKENAGQSLSTQEIINCIRLYEPDVKRASIIQNCSNMAKAKEIGVREGYKNKYYYIGNEMK